MYDDIHPYHILLRLRFGPGHDDHLTAFGFIRHIAPSFASCTPGPLCLLGELVAWLTPLLFLSIFLLLWMAGSKDPSSRVNCISDVPASFISIILYGRTSGMQRPQPLPARPP